MGLPRGDKLLSWGWGELVLLSHGARRFAEGMGGVMSPRPGEWQGVTVGWGVTLCAVG